MEEVRQSLTYLTNSRKELMATTTKTTMTVEEWREHAHQTQGHDEMQWKFQCPSCGHVATAQDYMDAGAPSSAVAYSCVGRWMNSPREAFTGGPGPCNYTGGGLIGINPVVVTDGDKTHRVFAFAE